MLTAELPRHHQKALLTELCTASRERPGPSVLVISAHPDDDILGLGGRLPHLAERASVVYVTDGAPQAVAHYRALGFDTRSAYALARSAEARQALRLAGISQDRVRELGIPDQALVRDLERAAKAIADLVNGFKPDVVITHAYEGGHPDHDGTACATHAALRCLAREGERRPVLLEFASYHAGATDLVRGRFVEHAECPSIRVELDAESRTLKLAMLTCHATQEPVWRTFPLEHEHFRVAPRYDFGQPPPVPFYYDRMPWSVSGRDFLRSARKALLRLGIAGPC